MPEWKCQTCGAKWYGTREITGMPHVCGGRDMVPEIVNVTPGHKHTRECLFGCPEPGKWEREQEQLATEALAELMYPPYPRE